MRRLFTFIFIALLMGFGALVGQIIRDESLIAECDDCFAQCHRNYVETGTYDATEFQWSGCRDYCRGVARCDASFARDYVELKLQALRMFGMDVAGDTPSVATPKGNLSATQKKPKAKATAPMTPLRNTSPKKGVLPQKIRKRTWKEAQDYCAAKGGRLPSKEELVQHLLLLPQEKRTGEKYWAQGPLYPDGTPPLVSMTADSFGVVPASPLSYHAVFCF